MTDVNERVKTLEERVLRLEAAARAGQQEVDDLYGRFKKSAEGHFALTERLMKRDDELFELLRLQKEVTFSEADLLRQTRKELAKLRDVYYHVFPERLAEDVRLLEEQEAAK
jgi:flagellar motility protein MotE (MotC chaperone)